MGNDDMNTNEYRRPYAGDESKVLDTSGLVYIGPCKITSVFVGNNSDGVTVQIFDGVNAQGVLKWEHTSPDVDIMSCNYPRGIRCDNGIYVIADPGLDTVVITYCTLPRPGR